MCSKIIWLDSPKHVWYPLPCRLGIETVIISERMAKLSTFFPLENKVFRERGDLVAIVWVVEDVVISSLPTSLPAYLSVFFLHLYLQPMSHKQGVQDSQFLRTSFTSRDANSSGAAAESAPSPSGLRQPCSERKTSMQKSHFTRFVIISFSFFPQPLFQKCIESLAFGSKLQGMGERKEDLQKT